MTTILRPLSTSELLDRTFHLYRNSFLVFVGINAIPQLFILALMLGGAALIVRHRAAEANAMIIGAYFLYLLSIFVSQAPTVLAVANLHFDKPITIRGAYSFSKRALMRFVWVLFLLCLTLGTTLLGTGILIGLAIGFVARANLGPWVNGIGGAALIVVPGYFLLRWMLTWSLVIPVTVLESSRFLASVRRSRFLTRGSLWRIFLIYFLMSLLGGVTGMIMQTILLLLVSLSGLEDRLKIQAVIQTVWSIGIFVSTTLVGALGTIAICLFYYDQRVRKEGLDLQLMIAHLEGVPQNSATATAL